MKPLIPRVGTDAETLAMSLGWYRTARNGVEVWYDPEGGHVFTHELPEIMKAALDQLIDGAAPALPEDLAALEKLGNPFRPQ